MELVEVVLYVRDMDRAIGFYRDTLDLPVAYESAGWTTFRTGACTLALHATERREPGAAEPDPTFLVADAAMERQRLIAAGVDVTEIRRPVGRTATEAPPASLLERLAPERWDRAYRPRGPAPTPRAAVAEVDEGARRPSSTHRCGRWSATTTICLPICSSCGLRYGLT